MTGGREVKGLSSVILIAALIGCDATTPSASVEPDPSPLGVFDLDETEAQFGVELAMAMIEGGRVRYVGEVGQVSFDIVVDPDTGGAIVQSTFRIGDSRLSATAREAEARAAWFAYIAERQPGASEWLRDALAEQTAAGGAEYARDEAFGDAVLAGLFAVNLPPSLDDDLGYASIVELYVQDARMLQADGAAPSP